jgi:hypothetical protein
LIGCDACLRFVSALTSHWPACTPAQPPSPRSTTAGRALAYHLSSRARTRATEHGNKSGPRGRGRGRQRQRQRQRQRRKEACRRKHLSTFHSPMHPSMQSITLGMAQPMAIASARPLMSSSNTVIVQVRYRARLMTCLILYRGLPLGELLSYRRYGVRVRGHGYLSGLERIDHKLTWSWPRGKSRGELLWRCSPSNLQKLLRGERWDI